MTVMNNSKKNLVAFLILGCFAQLTVAQSRTFEFTDSNGMCWRCYPGSPCVRCIPDSPRINEPPVDTWPTTCPAPDCNNPENRGENSLNIFSCFINLNRT